MPPRPNVVWVGIIDCRFYTFQRHFSMPGKMILIIQAAIPYQGKLENALLTGLRAGRPPPPAPLAALAAKTLYIIY
jgi:hypothetical protein